jgi:putative flippase GtrA
MNWQNTSAGSDTSRLDTANWSEAKETSKQIRRFLVVGLLSVLTDLGVYYSLVSGAVWSSGAAKALSYLAGVLVGFALNKSWTFESRRKSWSEPVTYLGLYFVTLLVNVLCNYLVLAALGNELRLPAFLFATGITTALNFGGMRLMTFRRGIDDRRRAWEDSDAAVSPTRKAG